MQTYTVHEQPVPPADRLERAEQLVFVKDGFSLPAAVLAPIWLLVNRLWLPFGAYLACMLIAGLVASLPGMAGEIGGWLMLAMHVIIGFEAASLRRWQLAGAGYEMISSVTGRNLDDCERRFLDAWLGHQPILAKPSRPPQTGRLKAPAFEPRST